MPGSSDPSSGAIALRNQAEERLREEPDKVGDMSPEQIHALIHELTVHQIELEMQNQNLRSTQMELEIARERYFDLYEMAPVGYITLDESGTIREANMTCVKLLDTDRSKLIGQLFTKFVLRADQEIYYLWWRKVLASNQAQSFEVRLVPANGIGFYARLETLSFEADRLACRLTISDITAQKRAEAAIREADRRNLQYEHAEQMRVALEAGELCAFDQDLATGRIVCSERACSMLGFSPQEQITWEMILDRIHPGDRERFLKEIEPDAGPGVASRFEATFRITRSDKKLRWLRLVGRCFFSESDSSRLVRRVGVLADNTPQIEAHELMHSEAKRLELLVTERTKRLEEAVSELEYFSYTLAHDLRAPLRAMKGFATLLVNQAPTLSPLHRQYLERISVAAGRMDELIVDALDYNKVVRGHFELTRIDCVALLRELIESYPQFSEPGAEIVIEGNIPPVLGNQALLTQCFSNLLNNAVKFVQGGQTPRVRITAEEKAGRVRILFQDNGIGIPQGCGEKIFQMFERLSGRFEGTGIGLALVRKAAERMGGAVGVKSEPGKGSQFWVELKKAPEEPR